MGSEADHLHLVLRLRMRGAYVFMGRCLDTGTTITYKAKTTSDYAVYLQCYRLCNNKFVSGINDQVQQRMQDCKDRTWKMFTQKPLLGCAMRSLCSRYLEHVSQVLHCGVGLYVVVINLAPSPSFVSYSG